MSKSSQYYTGYFEHGLEELSDAKFIARFNDQVECSHFGIPRSGLLTAIRNQLHKREINYSMVGDKKSISYKYCVFLKEKEMLKISKLKYNHVKELLNKYLWRNKTELNRSNSTHLHEYDNDEICYTFGGIPGSSYSLKSNHLIKTLEPSDLII